MIDSTRRDILATGVAATAMAAAPKVLAQAQGGAAMSFYERGPVRIHYEERGSGTPLLVIAGGGLNSTIAGLAGRAVAVQSAHRVQQRVSRHRRRPAQRQWRPVDGSARGRPSLGFLHRRPYRLDGPSRHRQVHGARLLHRRPLHLESVEARAQPRRRRRAGAAERLAPRGARSLLRQQHEGLGPGAGEATAGDHDGAGRQIPDQDVPHRSRLRVHGEPRFRQAVPDAGADHAGRHPGASLCGRDGSGDAGAEERKSRMFPWKQPKERIPLALRQVHSFLRAHRPATA